VVVGFKLVEVVSIEEVVGIKVELDVDKLAAVEVLTIEEVERTDVGIKGELVKAGVEKLELAEEVIGIELEVVEIEVIIAWVDVAGLVVDTVEVSIPTSNSQTYLLTEFIGHCIVFQIPLPKFSMFKNLPVPLVGIAPLNNNVGFGLKLNQVPLFCFIPSMCKLAPAGAVEPNIDFM
jgi:hypothetical protein